MWKVFIGESQTKAVHDYWYIPSKICHAIVFIQVVYSKKVQTFMHWTEAWMEFLQLRFNRSYSSALVNFGFVFLDNLYIWSDLNLKSKKAW